jgi:hypothetical protein
VKGLHVREVHEYTDHQKFVVDVKVKFQDAVAKRRSKLNSREKVSRIPT